MLKFVATVIFVFALMSASIASAQSLTRPQANAVRSAQAYLNLQGFSREGLIEQLSSPYGAR